MCPLFLLLSMTELRDKIEELVLNHLDDDALFLVDVSVAGGNNSRKVTVLIDSDQGLSIEDCAKVSRKLATDIEQLDLIDGKFVLDVSSPGVDQPLKLQRQYTKNIGRDVRVQLIEGSEKKGRLVEVFEEGILIRQKPKKKTKEVVEEKIDFSDIKYTKVLISFKK